MDFKRAKAGEQFQSAKTSLPKKFIRDRKIMTKKNPIKALKKEMIAIVEKSGLELRRENKKSRVTYFNSRRVLALEERKRYILVHLPRLDYLRKSEKVAVESKKDEEFRAKLLEFSLTRDSRYYTYIRIYSKKELESFKAVLAIASSNNR